MSTVKINLALITKTAEQMNKLKVNAHSYAV